MKIIVENDGKGKWQSFKAAIVTDENEPEFSYLSDYIGGYGATDEEARANLNDELKAVIDVLDSITFE